MTRTVGAAIGFVFIVLFFAAVAVEAARATTPVLAYAAGR